MSWWATASWMVAGAVRRSCFTVSWASLTWRSNSSNQLIKHEQTPRLQVPHPCAMLTSDREGRTCPLGTRHRPHPTNHRLLAGCFSWTFRAEGTRIKWRLSIVIKRKLTETYNRALYLHHGLVRFFDLLTFSDVMHSWTASNALFLGTSSDSAQSKSSLQSYTHLLWMAARHCWKSGPAWKVHEKAERGCKKSWAGYGKPWPCCENEVSLCLINV